MIESGDALSQAELEAYARDGYLAVENLVAEEDIGWYRETCDRLLAGELDLGPQRFDLGGFVARHDPAVENITQIMLPSDFVPELKESVYFRRAHAIARRLLGDEAEHDMDMIIDKAPGSATETPWHQDTAYWLPDMPDRRALSVWLALDEATVENGCMWFVPGSHRKPTRPHRWAGEANDTLIADVAEGEGVPVPLRPGSCTIHDGNMLHHTRGNATRTRRRALIVNYRPAAMIAWERERGFDHRSQNERGDEAGPSKPGQPRG